MIHNQNLRFIVAALGSWFMLAFAGSALATTWEQTSGDYCNVKNPGGEPAKKYSRKQAGALENLSFDFQFTVTCPLKIDNINESEWFVSASFANYSGDTQQYKCVLEEYDTYDIRVRAYTRSMTLEDDYVASIFFDEIRLSDPQNRLYMWCALPPRSIMGSLVTGETPNS